MRRIAVDVVWSVCLLDIVSPAKAAEPIEMLVGLWTRRWGGGNEQCIRSGTGSPQGKGKFGVGHVPGSEYGEL